MIDSPITYGLMLLALLVFFFKIHQQGKMEHYVLIVLYCLPVLDFRIVKEIYGGYKVFDLMTLYSMLFFIKEFTASRYRSNSYYVVLTALLLAVAWLGLLQSSFSMNMFAQLTRVASVFIFARFAYKCCQEHPDFMYRMLKAFRFSYMIALFFFLMQLTVGLNFTLYTIDLNNNTFDPDTNLTRYPGFFFDSQLNGQFLAMGAFLLLLREPGVKPWMMRLRYALFAFAVIGILASGSRSALGGFALAAFMLLLTIGRRYLPHLVLAGALAFFVIGGLKSGPVALQRTQQVGDDYKFRKQIWDEALEIAVKHPVLGIGMGNYQRYIMKYYQNQYLEIIPGEFLYFEQPENGYLKIIVELGFTGFILYLLVLLPTLAKAFIHYVNGRVAQPILFLIAGVCAWLVAFNTVYSIFDYRILVTLAMLLVLIYAYPQKTQNTYESKLLPA